MLNWKDGGVGLSTERDGLRQLLQADAALSARLAVPPGPLRLLALLTAHSGDSPFWLAGAAAAIIWGHPHFQSLGLRALAATLLGSAVATLLKFLFRRSRPAASYAALYSKLDQHAFPSGHATRVGCVAVALAPALPIGLAGLLAAWVGAVCLARVALQVHYILDVAVGVAVGALLGALLLLTVF